MTRLLLIRHGESEANLAHNLDCLSPGPPLSVLGRKQADALPAVLAADGITAIYASTMLRAQQTVEPLSLRLGLPIGIREGFSEFDVGDLHQRSDPAAHQLLDELMTRWLADGDLTAARPGGESGQQIVGRYAAATGDVLASHRHGTVVIATHGGVLRLALPRLACGVSAAFTLTHHVPNAAVVEVETTASGLRCRDWGGVPPY